MAVVVCIAIAAFILCVWWFALAGVPSKEKWPPISEDEFIRRCTPGVNRQRALKVRRIISEQLGADYDRV